METINQRIENYKFCESQMRYSLLRSRFWDVTQRSRKRLSRKRLGGALRDIPKNGCEGD